jgi:hypothetical protein
MSQENVETVQRLYGVWNLGDYPLATPEPSTGEWAAPVSRRPRGIGSAWFDS